MFNFFQCPRNVNKGGGSPSLNLRIFTFLKVDSLQITQTSPKARAELTLPFLEIAAGWTFLVEMRDSNPGPNTFRNIDLKELLQS